MKLSKLLLFSVVGGIAIALVTGLFDNTPEMLVGAAWYGYPLAWLVRRVVSPEYFPWVVRPLRLVGDIVFWGVLVAIALVAYTKIRKQRI